MKSIEIIDEATDHMLIILGTDDFYPKGRFLHQLHLEGRGYQTAVDIEVMGIGII